MRAAKPPFIPTWVGIARCRARVGVARCVESRRERLHPCGQVGPSALPASASMPPPKIPSLIVLSHVGLVQVGAEFSKIMASAPAGSKLMRHNDANCLMFISLDAACHGPRRPARPFFLLTENGSEGSRSVPERGPVLSPHEQGPHRRPALRRGFPRRRRGTESAAR